jgi:hypothetical protein
VSDTVKAAMDNLLKSIVKGLSKDQQQALLDMSATGKFSKHPGVSLPKRLLIGTTEGWKLTDIGMRCRSIAQDMSASGEL